MHESGLQFYSQTRRFKRFRDGGGRGEWGEFRRWYGVKVEVEEGGEIFEGLIDV